MEESEGTSFINKCDILSELWVKYKYDVQFSDFIEYNDIGLPLAFVVAEELAVAGDKGKIFIEETYDLLLKALGIEEDTGFESLDDLLLG